MDEDRGLTDSGLTEEVDSLETLWVSAELTADSKAAVEMIDTDLTEDMEAEECDAGEALADTDGLSVGDISVNSIDEEAGCSSAETQDMEEKQEKLRIKEDETGDSTADDLTESLTDGPAIPINENMKDTDTQLVFLSDGEEREEDSVSDCGITCNLLKSRCGRKMKEKGENLQNIGFYDLIPEDQRHFCDTTKKYVALEDDQIHEPYYVCSNDIINREIMPRNIRLPVSPQTPQKLSSVNRSGISDGKYEETGENVFLWDRKVTGMQSRSLSHCINNNGNEMGEQFAQSPYTSGFGQPALSSSPMLNSVRHNSCTKPHYLSLYPRSLSMEAQDMPLCVYRDMEDSQRQRGALCSSGSFSRCSPLSSSGLSTPTSVVDIPPPFELAYITKRPITKSSPSLLIDGDSSEKNRKKKSSIKRFLMLKFRRKTENKSSVDVSPCSFKTSAESSHHTPSRLLDLDRRSLSSSPQLNSRSASKPTGSSEPASTFLFYKDSKRKGSAVAFLNRSVVRVESFEDRSRVPFIPLPLTKPRSISFPNTDTSDYENVPAISSDYENVQVPQQRPIPHGPFTGFFDRPASSRVLSSANDTDGYVDMSSLPGFKSRTQSPEEETESAYTEAYNVCSVAVSPLTGSVADVRGETAGEEDQGRTSDEEDGGADSNYNRQDFREAVGSAVGDEGEPVVEEERLREILNELPDVYTLHRRILTELENRLRQWEESQRIADIFLSRKAEFLVFTTYIGHYDRSMSLLEDSCRTSPCFAAIVHQFEQSPIGEKVSLKHQLLQVIVRVAQYRMLLTDYLNNLSPDSKEYEDTQGTVKQTAASAENLLRLVNIEYSVHGQRDLLQPGRMNDVLLYTYPQQDGKYRLKNTLPLAGLKVRVFHLVSCCLCMFCSSFIEREDWFYTLSRAVTEHTRGSAAFNSCSGDARDRLNLSLGEKAPTLVPVSQVMMCMNCTADFSLTLRRHHCHGCGRIVCRSCSRNRYPLKYMKDRMAKVCDHCFNELKKRGGDVSALTAKSSPRPNRSSRPLSAVFQNIHPPNIWRHRKAFVSNVATAVQVTVSEEGSISGSLERSKKSKRNWKRLWFLLKDKVLYTYRAQEEKAASESLPLLGFTVKLPDRQEREEEANVFQLYHKNTLYYTFKAEDNHTAQRWANAMEEATVL
uniref:Uncharacterized protein n=1 Tax=Scophthalmus maximus TaxID=52904 RepID=A0A8D2ZI74_SCOMX